MTPAIPQTGESAMSASDAEPRRLQTDSRLSHRSKAVVNVGDNRRETTAAEQPLAVPCPVDQHVKDHSTAILRLYCSSTSAAASSALANPSTPTTANATMMSAKRSASRISSTE